MIQDCPHCHRQVRIQSSAQGVPVNCPHCHRIFVPMTTPLVEIAPYASPRHGPPRRKSSSSAWAWAISGAIVLAALIVSITWLAIRERDRQQADKYVNEAKTALEKLGR